MFSETVKRNNEQIHLERKIKRVKMQFEKESRVAYNHMEKWSSRGATYVPTWMAENRVFKYDLAQIKDGQQYFLMLKKYGRQYVLNQSQCKFLMASINERAEKITSLLKVNLIRKNNNQLKIEI